MKSILELNDRKLPVVPVDKSLNKYSDMVLFPEKVAKAKKAFDECGLPDLNQNSSIQGFSIPTSDD